MPETKILSPDEVAHLETQSQKTSLDYAEVDEIMRRIPALCATVRALEAQVTEWESHRQGFIELFETAEARVTDLESQLAAVTRERDLANSVAERLATGCIAVADFRTQSVQLCKDKQTEHESANNTLPLPELPEQMCHQWKAQAFREMAQLLERL